MTEQANGRRFLVDEQFRNISVGLNFSGSVKMSNRRPYLGSQTNRHTPAPQALTRADVRRKTENLADGAKRPRDSVCSTSRRRYRATLLHVIIVRRRVITSRIDTRTSRVRRTSNDDNCHYLTSVDVAPSRSPPLRGPRPARHSVTRTRT